MLTVLNQYFPGIDDITYSDQAATYLADRNYDHEGGGAEIAYALCRIACTAQPVQGSYLGCPGWHDVRNEILGTALPASCMSRIWWKVEYTNGLEGEDFRKWELLAGSFNEEYGFAILKAPHWDKETGLWICEDAEGMERDYDLFQT